MTYIFVWTPDAVLGIAVLIIFGLIAFGCMFADTIDWLIKFVKR